MDSGSWVVFESVILLILSIQLPWVVAGVQVHSRFTIHAFSAKRLIEIRKRRETKRSVSQMKSKLFLAIFALAAALTSGAAVADTHWDFGLYLGPGYWPCYAPYYAPYSYYPPYSPYHYPPYPQYYYPPAQPAPPVVIEQSAPPPPAPAVENWCTTARGREALPVRSRVRGRVAEGVAQRRTRNSDRGRYFAQRMKDERGRMIPRFACASESLPFTGVRSERKAQGSIHNPQSTIHALSTVRMNVERGRMT